MAIGDISFTIQDGAFALGLPADNQIPLILAYANGGSLTELVTVTSAEEVIEEFVSGDLVEAGCNYFDEGASALRMIRVNQMACGAVTDASAAGTLVTTGSLPRDFYEVSVVCTTLGAPGTAVVKYSLDDEATWVEDVAVPADGIISIEGTGLVLTISGTLAVDDSFSFVVETDAEVSAVEKDAAGSTDGDMTVTGSPLDAFQVVVEIVEGGDIGEASFRYSLDGLLLDVQPEIMIPESGEYTISNTGLTLVFDDATEGFTAGDKFSFSTTAPTYSLAALQAAIQIWLDSPREAYFLDIKGAMDSATAAAVDELLAEAKAAHKFSFAMVETVGMTEATPADFETTIKNEWADYLDDRIMVSPCQGDVWLVNRKLRLKRNASWVVGPRMAVVKPSERTAFYGRGPLRNINKIYHDARVNKGLNNKGYLLLRTYDNETNIYVHSDVMKVSTSSDYFEAPHRRVMDRACSVCYSALKPFLNGNLDYDFSNGVITKGQAIQIEQYVNSWLSKALIETQNCLEAKMVVLRTNNIFKDKTLKVKVRIRPYGYMNEISVDIGFENVTVQ